MQLCSNVVNKEKTMAVAESILQHVKDTLVQTLGPYGATTLVREGDVDHIMTKDGYNILKRLGSNEPISQTFLTIIKDISAEMVDKVGDGSTSCIIAAYYFYQGLKEYLKNNSKKRPKYVIDLINEVTNEIMEAIEKIKKPISEDLSEIAKLASVSLNNDVDTGELISEIYKSIGLEGFITVKLGNTEKTYYTKTKGIQLGYGRLDPIFVNSDSDESVLENSAILVFDAAVNSKEYIDVIMDALNLVNKFARGATLEDKKPQPYRSLTIIAPGYSTSCKEMLRGAIRKYREMNGLLNFNLINVSLSTDFDKEIMNDLCTLVDAQPILNSLYDKVENIEKYFGFAGKVVSAKKTTSFFNARHNDEKVEIAMESIRNDLQIMAENNVINDVRKYELKKRLAIMKEELVTIYVGGKSEPQRKTDKELINDAIAACKSAIDHGYVIGGNLSIVFAINDILNKPMSDSADDEKRIDRLSLLKMIKESFINVYKEVLKNGIGEDADKIDEIVTVSQNEKVIYDLVKEDYTNTDIINSAQTEIEILKNVISIITLILTSTQFVNVMANEIFDEIN